MNEYTGIYITALFVKGQNWLHTVKGMNELIYSDIFLQWYTNDIHIYNALNKIYYTQKCLDELDTKWRYVNKHNEKLP